MGGKESTFSKNTYNSLFLYLSLSLNTLKHLTRACAQSGAHARARTHIHTHTHTYTHKHKNTHTQTQTRTQRAQSFSIIIIKKIKEEVVLQWVEYNTVCAWGGVYERKTKACKVVLLAVSASLFAN